MPKLKEWLFGKKAKVKKAKTKTPEQEELQRLIDEGLKSGEGPFADIYGAFNEDEFKKGVSEPALKEFKDKTLPMLQEKFIANNQALTGGRQRAEALAGSDLQSQLAKLQYNAQQHQKQNRIQGVNTSLGTQNFENIYKPSSKGVVQGAVEGASEAAGKAAVNAVMG
jgi:hypothetical protein